MGRRPRQTAGPFRPDGIGHAFADDAGRRDPRGPYRGALAAGASLVLGRMMLAHVHGGLHNLSDLARSLDTLEGAFMIRRLAFSTT